MDLGCTYSIYKYDTEKTCKGQERSNYNQKKSVSQLI